MPSKRRKKHLWGTDSPYEPTFWEPKSPIKPQGIYRGSETDQDYLDPGFKEAIPNSGIPEVRDSAYYDSVRHLKPRKLIGKNVPPNTYTTPEGNVTLPQSQTPSPKTQTTKVTGRDLSHLLEEPGRDLSSLLEEPTKEPSKKPTKKSFISNLGEDFKTAGKDLLYPPVSALAGGVEGLANIGEQQSQYRDLALQSPLSYAKEPLRATADYLRGGAEQWQPPESESLTESVGRFGTQLIGSLSPWVGATKLFGKAGMSVMGAMQDPESPLRGMLQGYLMGRILEPISKVVGTTPVKTVLKKLGLGEFAFGVPHAAQLAQEGRMPTGREIAETQSLVVLSGMGKPKVSKPKKSYAKDLRASERQMRLKADRELPKEPLKKLKTTEQEISKKAQKEKYLSRKKEKVEIDKTHPKYTGEQLEFQKALDTPGHRRTAEQVAILNKARREGKLEKKDIIPKGDIKVVEGRKSKREAYQEKKTTESPKQIVEKNGGKYVGIQEVPESLKKKGRENLVLFNDKEGSTLAIPESKVSAETVKAKLEPEIKKPVKPEPKLKVVKPTKAKEVVEKIIGKPEKQPWEMSKEEYAKHEYDKELKVTDVKKHGLIGPRGMENQARLHHKVAVEKAIAEGKIKSHPDYPELTISKKETVKTKREAYVEKKEIVPDTERKKKLYDEKYNAPELVKKREKLRELAEEIEHSDRIGENAQSRRTDTIIRYPKGKRQTELANEYEILRKDIVKIVNRIEKEVYEQPAEPTAKERVERYKEKKGKKDTGVYLGAGGGGMQKIYENLAEKYQAEWKQKGIDKAKTFKQFLEDSGVSRKEARKIMMAMRRERKEEKISESDSLVKTAQELSDSMGKKTTASLKNQLEKRGFDPNQIHKILFLTGKGITRAEKEYRLFKGEPSPYYEVGQIVDGREIAKKPPKAGMEPVFKDEFEILKSTKVVEPPRGAVGEVYRKFKIPIVNIEEQGKEFKRITYDRVETADLAQVREMHDIIRPKIKAWKKSLKHGASERIGKYLISEQEGGKEILEEMKVKVEKLTREEYAVAGEMRAELRIALDRLNDARFRAGRKPIKGVKNYFTFFKQLDYLKELGIDPVTTIDMNYVINQHFIHQNATSFKHSIARTKNKIPVDLDSFKVFDRYMDTTTRHIHISPEVAKIRQFLKPFIKKVGDKKEVIYDMSESNPYLFKSMNEWLDHTAGKKIKDMPKFEATVRKLSSNVGVALLAYNLRSAGIQISAIRNTLPIAKGYMLEGTLKTLDPKARAFAWKHSNLIARQYDVTVEDFMNSVSGVKRGVARVGMKPLQFLDIQTAMASWNAYYAQATKSLKMEHPDAVRYANDWVVKTQASARQHHMSPIQRTAYGKALTTLQTFVISDWNFFAKEILGVGGKKMTKERLGKVLWYLGATTAINSFFEDVVGVYSPFATPIRAAYKATKEGKGWIKALQASALEMTDILPVISSKRFGSMGGAALQAADDVLDIAFAKKSWKYLADTAGKILGIPGTGQVSKTVRGLKKGKSIPEAIIGTKYEKKKKAKKSPTVPTRSNRSTGRIKR